MVSLFLGPVMPGYAEKVNASKDVRNAEKVNVGTLKEERQRRKRRHTIDLG